MSTRDDTSPADERPVALITGATRGLGLEIARVLAPTHRLVLGGRTAQSVAAVVDRFEGASGFVADLADEDATAAAASGIERLDVLVHSAGILPPQGVGVRASWRTVLEVNVVAVVHLTELVLPMLREASGLIVFVNSGAGLRAMGDTGGYSASKFALTSYADGLRDAERGRVRVSSLHPGRIDTDMQRDLQARAGREYEPSQYMTAASVADVVGAIVAAPRGSVLDSVAIRPS